MKERRTAQQLEDLIRAELSPHHAIPPGFKLSVIRDGDTWRVSSPPDPNLPELGELIGHAVEVGDELARHYDLDDQS
ncbi:MAG: hypothetical protein ACLP8B_22455 [Xanthobacteraceae bacterium]